MIRVFVAENGELCYSERRPNGKVIGQNETYKRKAGLRNNVRAKLLFWGGKSKIIVWPDGVKEVVTVG